LLSPFQLAHLFIDYLDVTDLISLINSIWLSLHHLTHITKYLIHAWHFRQMVLTKVTIYQQLLIVESKLKLRFYYSTNIN